jgi:RNA polymerase sigma factor (sigma-70 family)
MNDLTDIEVFELFRESRQQSYFEEIDRRYRDRLVALVTKMTDHHSAEDVASQALVAAFLKCDLFDSSKGSLQSWLYQIARNEAKQILYQNSAKKRGGGRRPCAIKDDDCFSDSPALSDAERDQLMMLVWRLEEIDRQIVFGIYWDELSQRAVAAKLSTTHYEVQKRLTALLQRLQPDVINLGVA